MFLYRILNPDVPPPTRFTFHAGKNVSYIFKWLLKYSSVRFRDTVVTLILRLISLVNFTDCTHEAARIARNTVSNYFA